jgi:peptidoglycan/xylan/chitin deacetylase (PgdA/CDA1 family)
VTRSVVVGAVPPERLIAAASTIGHGPVADALVGALERATPWRRGVLAVLTYHRVDDPTRRPDLLPGLLSATPAAFATQMTVLAERYRPVSMAEVLEALPDPRRLPPRAVLVTFDDAYVDFAEHAWPVLVSSSVPATLFVPTAFPGQPVARFWWDRLWDALRTTTLPEVPDPPYGRLPLGDSKERAAAMRSLRDWLKGRPHGLAMSEVERLVGALSPDGEPDRGPSVLGWHELRRLAGEGLTLAPHTRTHPLLDQVPTETAIEEITGSREDLEREVGPVPPVLAYPSGAHGGEAVDAARWAGMVLAVTTERGGNDLRHADPLRIRRINVGGRAHAPIVRGQLIWASTLSARRR